METAFLTMLIDRANHSSVFEIGREPTASRGIPFQFEKRGTHDVRI